MSATLTLLAFIGVLLVLPLLLVLGAVSSWLRKLLHRLVQNNPDLVVEPATLSLRAILDTPRNQGIAVVVVRVQGPPDHASAIDVLRSASQRFPHLCTPLIKRWGVYAWCNGNSAQFDIRRHVILCNALYRGRPITPGSVQEVVSSMTAKYLPADIPAWQVVLIPMAGTIRPSHLILVRVHHLLLTKDGMKIEDLVPIPCQYNLDRFRSSPVSSPPPSVMKSSGTGGERSPLLGLYCAAPRFDAVSTFFTSLWPFRAKSKCSAKELFHSAVNETLSMIRFIYTSPRIVLEELFFSSTATRHQLQTVTLCGRKVIAWSDPFPLASVRRIAKRTSGNSDSDAVAAVLITAVSGALRDSFRLHGLPVPENVLATARAVGADGHDDGLLCIPLPMSPPSVPSDSVVGEVRTRLRSAREKQPSLWKLASWQNQHGFLTRFLPHLAVRLGLNVVSRRYAVAIAEAEDGAQICRKVGWGSKVEWFITWRPPQANVSMSLTLVPFDGTVYLAVMADAQLAPQHIDVARAFCERLRDLCGHLS